MKLAFCLFHYFPFGGLQRDFLKIALACRNNGHDVHIFTSKWEGDTLDLPIQLFPVKGKQNHTRNQAFIDAIQKPLIEGYFDRIIGFNKMPGLDIYYAADGCYAAQAREKHGFLYRLLPRYRALIAQEKAVFQQDKPTQILLIAEKQKAYFQHHYQTESQRFHLLPPGIRKDCIPQDNQALIRETVRQQGHVQPDQYLILMIASRFKTKGVDRTIAAIAALPTLLKEKIKLWVIGPDNPKPYLALAKKQGLAHHIHFLGARDDIPALLLAGDLLLHPARQENTGTVLLEAQVAGLPVLTLDICGYAPYIEKAQGGMVLHGKFNQAILNTALYMMIKTGRRQRFKENALRFTKQADLYHLVDHAVAVIEGTR